MRFVVFDATGDLADRSKNKQERRGNTNGRRRGAINREAREKVNESRWIKMACGRYAPAKEKIARAVGSTETYSMILS